MAQPVSRPPTSQVLAQLVAGAQDETVSLAWLIAHLRERSFGIVMLILGVVALIPGVSGFVGVLLAIPAFQMMMARRGPVFPRFLARRSIPTRRFARLVARIDPVLIRMERVIRPRWPTPFESTKRVVGFVLLLLGLALLAPIPFSQMIVALAIVLLSFAYLEEDGLALCIGLAAALATLAATAATVWAAVLGIDFVGRL